MQAKKLPMVRDLRDESDSENPTRLVIIPRSNRTDISLLMNHLFVTTDLERHYRVNMNVIGLNGKPQVKGLLNFLSEWLDFRFLTTQRRLTARLEKVSTRLKIVDGLLITFLNLQQVIDIIREKDDPKKVLMDELGLSEIQTHATLELKLRQLMKLEEAKLQTEKKSLNQEKTHIERILNSKQRLKTLVKKEILQAANDFSDPRRSPLVIRDEARAFTEADLTQSELVTVIVSKMGWVRCAKGHEILPHDLNYKSGDEFGSFTTGKSHQYVTFLDSTGRSFSQLAHKLPSARGQGEPLTKYFNLEAGSTFVDTFMAEKEKHYLFSSDAGYGFIGTFSNTLSKAKNGKSLMSLPKGAKPLSVIPLNEKDLLNNDLFVVVISNEGRLLLFSLSELPHLSRGKGNQMMAIPSNRLLLREEYLLSLNVLSKKSSVIIHSGKRHLTLKFNDLAHYQGKRGQRGNKLPRGFQRVDSLRIETE
jgi:topoisomerase-4 subunit A